MATTTPSTRPQTHIVPQRSASQTRAQLPSRPTTPLRAPSRASLRSHASITTPTAQSGSSAFPLNALEPALAELSDSMADLEANFLNLQVLNESVSRFNESFSALLYGLNMSAFCVDFPEAPGAESFKRARDEGRQGANNTHAGTGWDDYPRPAAHDVDATFLTTDTSFVENPPASVRPAARYTDPMAHAAPSSRVPASTRGRGSTRTRGNTSSRAARGGTTRGTATERARGRYAR